MPIPDNINEDKLAEIGLAIHWLGVHGRNDDLRVWKNVDWEVTDLLFEKGWIADPKSKAKSVLLTEEGKELAQRFFDKYFKQDFE